MEKTRAIAIIVSGLMGFIFPTYFAWTLYQQNLPQNIATWSMVLLLDCLGLFLAYKDGNKKPYLLIGWTLAAACIVVAITIGKSPWHWGWPESVSLFLCGVAVMLWLTMSARRAIWAYTIAMYVSFVPLMIDYYKPQLETLWLWLGTIVTCILAIHGAPKRDFTHIFVPISALILNAIILILCIM